MIPALIGVCILQGGGAGVLVAAGGHLSRAVGKVFG